MTTILALDLGTKTGFGLTGANGVFMSGEWDFADDRHKSPGRRVLKLRETLEKIHAAHRIDEIYYEAVNFMTTTYAAQVYGSLVGEVQAFAIAHEIEFEGVSVGEIKKYATGKGNAKKDAMILAARKFGYAVPDKNDNEADALCLLHYAISKRLFV